MVLNSLKIIIKITPWIFFIYYFVAKNKRPIKDIGL